jgi:hypothetical protein
MILVVSSNLTILSIASFSALASTSSVSKYSNYFSLRILDLCWVWCSIVESFYCSFSWRYFKTSCYSKALCCYINDGFISYSSSSETISFCGFSSAFDIESSILFSILSSSSLYRSRIYYIDGFSSSNVSSTLGVSWSCIYFFHSFVRKDNSRTLIPT